MSIIVFCFDLFKIKNTYFFQSVMSLQLMINKNTSHIDRQLSVLHLEQINSIPEGRKYTHMEIL